MRRAFLSGAMLGFADVPKTGWSSSRLSRVFTPVRSFYMNADRNQERKGGYVGKGRIISSDLQYSVEGKGSQDADIKGRSRYITPVPLFIQVKSHKRFPMCETKIVPERCGGQVTLSNDDGSII